VHELGGKVVVVTNRNTVECPDTLENLRAEGLEFDEVLCKSDTSDKNPRFKSVADGTAAPSLPPLDVVLWTGDNILDFPGLDQTARTDDAKLADFGSRFVIVPNAMYGSWEKNPQD
jgi:predicted secreted acid phosphatase